MKDIKRIFPPARNILLIIFAFAAFFIIYNLSFIIPAQAAYPNCVTNDPDPRCVIGGVNDPTGVAGNSGDEQLSNFLSLIVRLIYIVAAVVFTFMIIFGAFQWITSGGDKEGLDKARKRITHAIIGLVLLALSFVIINVIANITNLGILAVPFAGSPPSIGTPTCSGDRTWDPIIKRCI